MSSSNFYATTADEQVKVKAFLQSNYKPIKGEIPTSTLALFPTDIQKTVFPSDPTFDQSKMILPEKSQYQSIEFWSQALRCGSAAFKFEAAPKVYELCSYNTVVFVHPVVNKQFKIRVKAELTANYVSMKSFDANKLPTVQFYCTESHQANVNQIEGFKVLARLNILFETMLNAVLDSDTPEQFLRLTSNKSVNTSISLKYSSKSGNKANFARPDLGLSLRINVGKEQKQTKTGTLFNPNTAFKTLGPIVFNKTLKQHVRKTVDKNLATGAEIKDELKNDSTVHANINCGDFTSSGSGLCAKMVVDKVTYIPGTENDEDEEIPVTAEELDEYLRNTKYTEETPVLSVQQMNDVMNDDSESEYEDE